MWRLLNEAAVQLISRAAQAYTAPTVADAHQSCVALQNDGLGTAGTIPGRWLRSAGDAGMACQWGLRVRVVKGQWPDPRQPNMDMRLGLLRVIHELRGSGVCVAVATHDIPLARQALCHLLEAGTPCELELLYGLPRRVAIDMALLLDVPIRVYVPQGKAWLPYLLSQARKNPRVLGWFA